MIFLRFHENEIVTNYLLHLYLKDREFKEIIRLICFYIRLYFYIVRTNFLNAGYHDMKNDSVSLSSHSATLNMHIDCISLSLWYFTGTGTGFITRDVVQTVECQVFIQRNRVRCSVRGTIFFLLCSHYKDWFII